MPRWKAVAVVKQYHSLSVADIQTSYMSTLFIVDDNQIDRHILRFHLAKLPVYKHVQYFDGGLPLIGYLKEFRDDAANLPDAVLLDLHMPGFDGWDVLAELATFYDTLSKKIAVYVVSASINPVDIEQAMQYSFVMAFVSKPITQHALIAISKKTIVGDSVLR